MATPSFHIFNLPKEPNRSLDDPVAKTLTEKYRDLRLFGFKNAPDSFTTKYEEASQRQFSAWWEALQYHVTDQFFALDRPVPATVDVNDESQFQDLENGNWIGMITLWGPTDPSDPPVGVPAHRPVQLASTPKPVAHKADSGEPTAKSNGKQPLNYEMVGFFVHPSARRMGLGLALIETALAKAKSTSEQLQTTFECTVLVYETNHAARALYQKAGFRFTGEQSTHEGRVALHMQFEKPVAVGT